MIRRILFVVVMAMVSIGSSAWADEILTAAEIEELLVGNTISGDWGGHYMQYYEADGFTMYVPESGDPDPGKWRANPEENTYESWWAGTGWVGYQIARDGDDAFVWIDSKGDRYPFIVLEGKQVDW